MVYCFYTQGVRMRVVGVIAEYNPLHNGHIYHLERAKTLSGADYCIVVLSGSFVQRGEAACMDKYTRAGWAVKAGGGSRAGAAERLCRGQRGALRRSAAYARCWARAW